MKNIFKKNQIIITALLIMIVIAGYLSFTNKDKSKKNTKSASSGDYEVITEDDDKDAAKITGAADTAKDTTAGAEDAAKEDVAKEDAAEDDTAKEDTAKDVTAETEDSKDTAKTDDDSKDTAQATDNDETTPVDNVKDKTEDTADISDKDILDSAKEVSDTGEIKNEDGVPGEAVLASTTLDGNFFTSQRLEREQDRSRSKEDLQAIINSTSITQEAKDKAIDRLLELSEIAEKENGAEVMLMAKGFDDALVSIDKDGAVDVVINAPSITDQQRAIIETVVMKKTDATIEQITINPVIISE